MDRTFVVTATKDISADGADIKTGDQVAVVTSWVSPMTLFGLLQFHGFTLVEIACDSPQVVTSESVAEPKAEEAQTTQEAKQPSEPEPEIEPAQLESETENAVSQFMADGLKEKTARALAEMNDLDPVELRKMIAEGYDLIELEGIGPARVEEIQAIYQTAKVTEQQ